MKRILVYVVIFIQIVTISIFVIQFERIDATGTEITLKTRVNDEFYHDDFPLEDNAYVQYDISIIKEEQWEGASDLGYGTTVYVLLEKGENGYYEVVVGSHEKPSNINGDTVIVPAIYGYYDETEKHHEINYEFQYLNKINRFGSFNYLDDFEVTLKVGKWGQYKIIDIRVIK